MDDRLNEFKTLILPILAEHTEELQFLLQKWNARPDFRMGSNVRFPEWTNSKAQGESQIVIKYGIERVENANRLRTVIQERALEDVDIPLKFLYHVPGQPVDLDSSNYLVVVQRIPHIVPSGLRFMKVNREQVRCIYKLAMHGPHYDMHGLNWILSPDGKVYIIDTDGGAMPTVDKIEELHQDWLEHFDHLNAPGGGTYTNPSIINHPLVKIQLHMMSKHCCFDAAAYAYMGSKISKYRQSHPKFTKSIAPTVPTVESISTGCSLI